MTDPTWHILTQITSYLYPAALRAVVLLEVADHLADGPRSSDELAKLTGTDSMFLRRLLRYLAAHDTFREDDEGRFHLTPYADVLRADAPRSVRAAVLLGTAETWWLSAQDLAEAARHGEPAFNRHYGRSFFSYLAEHPDEGALFRQGMANYAAGDIELVAATYDGFPETGVVVDVGGGTGGLLLAVLRDRPGLHGVLLDQEQVLADHVLDELDAPDRWTLAPGDFFSSVPQGDLYLLKTVLHDWTDDQCVRILENCRKAMNPGARLLVVDPVLPPGNEQHFGRNMDMVMLLLVPGHERTRAEFEAVFDRAGFRITRVIPTAGPLSMVEGAPTSD